MSLLIFLLISFIRGSFGFVFLIAFLVSIVLRMCMGKGVVRVFSLPLGMWCLSAVRIAWVSVLLAVCGSCEAELLVRIFSISAVKFVQFALL